MSPVVRRRSRYVLLAALLAIGAVGFILLTRRSHLAIDKEPDRVMIVVSGDTSDWIVPCGCTSNQSGGLSRRGSLVKELRRRADVVLLDAGGAPGGTVP